MSFSRKKQRIILDSSSLAAFLSYLKEKSSVNLGLLISTPGAIIAYRHNAWSSMDSKTTIRDFWKRTLQDVTWDKRLTEYVNSSIEYLESRKEDLLSAVLRYLPPSHVFGTTVHFILGYDNIVYGEDVALNLNSKHFRLDNREILYYLIHELAHAGYFRYRPMPSLAEISTMNELIGVVKLARALCLPKHQKRLVMAKGAE